MVDDFLNGKLDIDSFITHHLPLQEINHSLDLMHEGKSIRAIIQLHE
jgi:S-(hydroxymethyl)glutathione dehydrogenase/alcohol dehydrogenase